MIIPQTAPASGQMPKLPKTIRFLYFIDRLKMGSVALILLASAGAYNTTTMYWSRWTLMVLINPNSYHAYYKPLMKQISSSDPVEFQVERWSTGRGTASSCPSAVHSTPS